MNGFNKLIIKYILYINILFIYVLLNKVAFSQDSLFQKFYYPNGNISSEGYLLNNLPAGQWTNYHVNGKKKSIGFWKNNKLEGNWIFFDTLGNKIMSENYVFGKRDGEQIKYDSNGLIKISTFANGVKEGKEYIYYQNLDSVIKLINIYSNNQKDGKAYEYDTSGRVITIFEYNMGLLVDQTSINQYDNKGEKHGKWITFFSNFQIKKEENYNHGVLNGISKIYTKNGGIKKLENFKDGKESDKKINLSVSLSVEEMDNNQKREGIIFKNQKQGLFKVYDSTNQVILYEFYSSDYLVYTGMYDSLNLKKGEWVYYDDKNNIAKKGSFFSNKKDKEWTFFYKNGQIQQQGSYNKGKPVGEWNWWYENKQLWRNEFYDNGNINGLATEYDSLGNLITKGEYLYGLKEGIWFYEINDYKEQGSYISDMKSGTWEMTYLSSNKKMFIGEFLNDIPVGEHIYYHPNGAIKEIGKYENGEKQGEWKKFDDNGNVLVTYLYKRGVEIKRDGFKVK